MGALSECRTTGYHIRTSSKYDNVLNNNIDDAFKFSPNPNLMGWNPLMEIVKIMDQLVMICGRPTPIVLFQNDTLFCSVYSPLDAPEILFCQIEDCQEIQMLGDDPYTPCNS